MLITTTLESQAVDRIDAQLLQLAQIIKSSFGQINREVTNNRDKLTKEQIETALGADKVANLKAAQAEGEAWVNKWMPGTFLT